MKKKLLALLMATVLMGTMVACGTKTDKPADDVTPTETVDKDESKDEGKTEGEEPAEVEAVTLKVWAPENQIQPGTMNKMFESFQAANPQWDITFSVDALGEDVAKDEILKDVAAAADVYFFANDQLQELVNAGAIAKLGGTTETMVKDTMAQAVVDTVTVDGSIYAIPFTHNTFFMYYDKSLLTEDDVKTVEGIMAKETAADVYNFVFDSAGGWKLGAWYYGAGNTIYGADGTDYAAGADWNNAKGLAVTNYLIDLLANPKTAYADDVSITELAASHRVGAWFDGSWNYELYKTELGDDLGLAILPTFNPDGTDYQLKGFYGSKAIGVNPQASNLPAAVAFAAYLGGEEMQLQRFVETAQVPTNLTVGASADVQNNAVAAVIVKEAEVASVMQPTSAEFSSKYWPNAGGFATEMRAGTFNKDNAQEKLDTFVETLKVQ